MHKRRQRILALSVGILVALGVYWIVADGVAGGALIVASGVLLMVG